MVNSSYIVFNIVQVTFCEMRQRNGRLTLYISFLTNFFPTLLPERQASASLEEYMPRYQTLQSILGGIYLLSDKKMMRFRRKTQTIISFQYLYNRKFLFRIIKAINFERMSTTHKLVVDDAIVNRIFLKIKSHNFFKI